MNRSIGIGLAGLLASACPLPAHGASVPPVLIAGNVTACSTLGLGGSSFSTGSAPVDGQPYAIDAFGNTVTFTYAPPGQERLIDFVATLPLDAVVVKAGNAANAFFYAPERDADTGLFGPDNPNGEPAGVSHVVVCWDYELDVAKTAETGFTRRFEWDIDKQVVPAQAERFVGDSQAFDYVVEVDKSAPIDSDFTVSGSVTIDNATPLNATLVAIEDELDGDPVALDCGGFALPGVLAAGASLQCSYSVAVDSGATRQNVVTVTTSGAVGGGSAQAMAVFDEPTTVEGDSIHVSDSLQGDLGSFSADGSTQYTREEDCGDAGERDIDNTATIAETGASASASATLGCHALQVSKEGAGSFERQWTWNIDKRHDLVEPLLLTAGQSYAVDYDIVLTAQSQDSGHAAAGTLTIANPNPDLEAALTLVADELEGGIAAQVDCPAMNVAAGGSLVCSWSADLPDGGDRLNTATATLQNHAYDAQSNATPTGTTDFSGSAPVAFGDTPQEETDECVTVSDDYLGNSIGLGQVCAGQLPKTLAFTGEILVGEDSECAYEVENLARFVADDSGAEGGDSTVVQVTRSDCAGGCTLTPGYWKTHSAAGPAPYDATWALIGEDTPFFLATKKPGQPLSWLETLWTAPQGNAYFILARAWIAATLNTLNGASASAQVLNALEEAQTSIFMVYTPAQIGALRGNRAPRPRIIELAGVLDQYNNGIGGIGPPHCSEDARSGN